MSDTFNKFPRGSIAMGNGDLMQVTNVKVSLKNGAKLKHTLRKKGAGAVLGNEECTVTFDYEIPETGPEKDYMDLVQTGAVKQLRLKVPAKTYTVNGVYSSSDMELPLDDAIKGSCEFIGKMDKPS